MMGECVLREKARINGCTRNCWSYETSSRLRRSGKNETMLLWSLVNALRQTSATDESPLGNITWPVDLAGPARLKRMKGKKGKKMKGPSTYAQVDATRGLKDQTMRS